MTEKEIHDQVTELFDAIKSNNDPKQREIGALMVTRFLFNMERIADGLSRLSETVGDPNDQYVRSHINTKG